MSAFLDDLLGWALLAGLAVLVTAGFCRVGHAIERSPAARAAAAWVFDAQPAPKIVTYTEPDGTVVYTTSDRVPR